MEADALHDALNRTIYSGAIAQKVIAADLDLSPSELSRMVSRENSLRFPHERLAKLMQITGNYCYLEVLAELSGFELRPKEISPTELVNDLIQAIQTMPDKIGEVIGPLVEAIQNGGTR